VAPDAIGKNKERWKELCEQAALEQDPAKLIQLVKEIRDLLEDCHEKRVREQRVQRKQGTRTNDGCT